MLIIFSTETSDIAMHEMHNGERIYVEKRAPSSGSGFKSFLLAIYIVIVLILITTLVLQICSPSMLSEKVPFL